MRWKKEGMRIGSLGLEGGGMSVCRRSEVVCGCSLISSGVACWLMSGVVDKGSKGQRTGEEQVEDPAEFRAIVGK